MKHILGSALEPIGRGNFIIAHVVNDRGMWGAGFVLPLAKKFPQARKEYLALKNHKSWMGGVQGVEVRLAQGESIRWGVIANMFAQVIGSRERPLDIDALASCISHVQDLSMSVDAKVHAPRIGCGLGKAEWKDIAPLVPDSWVIYTLPNERHKFPEENYESPI
jgi:O-acetyl-ADP-ribose deacetylase (regulator of RNase III)